jgi:hypothetical protein
MRLLICLTPLVFAVASPAVAQTPPLPVTIFNVYFGMCLQPVSGSADQGVAIVQEPCNDSAAQQWIQIPLVGAGTHYMNALSGTVFPANSPGLCLDARGGAANRTPVQQWTCNGISNENWEPEQGGPNGGPLVSEVAHSNGYCLDIPGGQKIVGLAMQIYRCNGTISQIWQLKQAGYRIVPLVNGLSEVNAIGKITLFGLGVGKTSYTGKCDPKQDGSVIGQDKVPGAVIGAPASVTLTVCSVSQGSAHQTKGLASIGTNKAASTRNGALR